MKKIAIASTLKPVDDVRAFEKIAQSIAKTNKYEVNIIGNSGKKESNHPGIRFYPHFVKKRSFISRWFIREKALLTLFKIKPRILIITTHELINTSLLLKLLTGCKVIYDVQENYERNLGSISNYPLSNLAGKLIRLKERFSRLFVSQYWLAEKCYLDELPFSKSKSIVIENKAKSEPAVMTKEGQFNVLFSGTISNYSQPIQAIHLYEKIAKIIPDSTLTIIGQCHDKSLAKTLAKHTDKNARIKLIISEHPISHQDIISRIFDSDLGIISYQENDAIRNKVPTKLYEYSRYKLPYLIQTGTSWEVKSRELGGAIPINFSNPNLNFIIKQLKKTEQLHLHHYPKEETWESLEEVIITSLNKL
ncbi:MAG: hypothetical protein RIM99_15510 [Cyclobacteriaceae bacterium]